MAKISLKTSLKKTGEKTNLNDLKGIMNDDIIQYKEGQTLSIITIKNDEVTITRKHPEYEIYLPFKKGKKLAGTYLLKEYQKTLELIVKTNDIKKTSNSIYLNYDLDIGDETIHFEFELVYEVKK